MDVTGSVHVRSLKPRESFKGLQDKHFNIDRERKGIAKRAGLTSLNKYIDFPKTDLYVEKLRELDEQRLSAFNAKPSQAKNKARQYKDLSDLIERKQADRRANPDFNGLEYLMVAKVADMDAWNQIVELFGTHNVSEEDTLDALNGAFDSYFKWFNKTFSNGKMSGNEPLITLLEGETNLDELGAPHAHYRVRLCGTTSTGLPETNFSKGLRRVYGDGHSNKALMSKFREDCDTALISFASDELVALAKERGFDFDGLHLIRKKAERTGLDHDRYVEDARIEARIKEIEERERSLDNRETSLDSRELTVEKREEDLEGLSEREEKIKDTEEALRGKMRAFRVKEDEILERDKQSAQNASQWAEKVKESDTTMKHYLRWMTATDCLDDEDVEMLWTGYEKFQEFVERQGSNYESVLRTFEAAHEIEKNAQQQSEYDDYGF